MDRYVDYHPDFDGIKGWLIGLAALLSLCPFLLYQALGDDGWKVLLSTERWHSLTKQGSVNYDARWQTILLFNVVFSGLLLLASFVQLYLFFQRHALFPRFFIGFLFATVTFVIVSAILATRIPEVQNTQAARYAWRVVIAMVVGVTLALCVLRSARIRFTFNR